MMNMDVFFVQKRPPLLRNDVPAHQRQLLRHEKAREANYWVIPP